ncbi:hypothetical protein A2U01_0062618, partial [Trifolium medium]|nr:hypothetical protein [Trifolium medium]
WIKWDIIGYESSLPQWWLQASPCFGNTIGANP